MCSNMITDEWPTPQPDFNPKGNDMVRKKMLVGRTESGQSCSLFVRTAVNISLWPALQ